MAIKIFTIPFNPEKQAFEEKDMQDFLMNKKVDGIKSEFFQLKGQAYWTIIAEYDAVFAKVPAQVFSEPERLLFEKLQIWRKERAEKDGVPVFLVATNSEFTQIVHRAPKTLDGLRMIKGFGKKKAEKYGKDILDLIGAFYERKNGKPQPIANEKPPLIDPVSPNYPF